MKNKKILLSGIAEVFNGKTPSKAEKRNEGYPVLKIKDIDENGKFKGAFNSFIDSELAYKFSDKILKKNDILILNAAHSSEYVGSKIYIVDEQAENSLATGEWLIIRSNVEKVNPLYLYYWFLNDVSRDIIRQLVKGIHLYPRDVAFIKMNLPPLLEQNRIAFVLELTDGLRRKRRQAIELLDELLRGTFLDRFGDPIRNPKGWEEIKFSKAGTLDRGKSKHRPRNDPKLLGGPYPLIQTGDVANSGVYITQYNRTYSQEGLKQSRMWPAGTLCITIAANIADTGILTFDSCFPDSIVGFTPNKRVKTEYVKFLLSFMQKILKEIAPESAQKNINLQILRNLDIPLPPIELQSRFAEIVTQAELIRDKLQKSLEEMDNLFHSLMQRAFKGELNLNEAAVDSLMNYGKG